jgi:thymidylate synthase ThyX
MYFANCSTYPSRCTWRLMLRRALENDFVSAEDYRSLYNMVNLMATEWTQEEIDEGLKKLAELEKVVLPWLVNRLSDVRQEADRAKAEAYGKELDCNVLEDEIKGLVLLR